MDLPALQLIFVKSKKNTRLKNRVFYISFHQETIHQYLHI